MNDNPPPFGIHQDDQLEARITAWVLGESSPFEIAELESLVAKSPELQLFLNRTRALHSLLQKAETTANAPSEEWKLPNKKRAKLSPILGDIPILVPDKETRIRRASFRAAWGIAAIVILTFFTKRFLAIPPNVQKETAFTVSDSAAEPDEPQAPVPPARLLESSQGDDVIHIGGQVKSPGPQKFKEGLKLADAVESAGGATEFGSSKRVRLFRDGKTQTYDITDERLAKIELQPNDTIEMPQKNFFGDPAPSSDNGIEIAGNTRAKDQVIRREVPTKPESKIEKTIAENVTLAKRIPIPEEAAATPSADFGEGDDLGAGWGGGGGAPEGKEIASLPIGGNRSGDQPVTRNSIDAILNNPARTSNRKPESPTTSNSMEESKRLRESGRYDEARDILTRNAQAEGVDEAKLKEEIATLDLPIRSNPALPLERAANEQADPFEVPAAPGEIGSLTGLFSAREEATRLEENDKVPQLGEIPLLGRLFQEADPFWDTSDAVAKNEGKGGVEYEINSGYKSEYLLRGVDLSKHLTGFTGDADPDSLWLNAEGEAGNDIASIVEENTRLQEEIPNAAKTLKQKLINLADLSQEIPAAQEPFSTFSLNISDASFQLALAAEEKGERPDPTSIKPEQFYNAVDYGDPAPSSLEPVAAAIDQTAHPVIPGRNLVRVAIRTASTGRSAAQPLRLTLLVDQSGSMARADRRTAMNAALAQLATLLTENDQVTVIGFSRTPRLIADALPGNEAAKLPDLINPTASEGGTNLEQALNLSSELALRHKLDGAQNRIVLFTDGAANLGDADPDRLAERVKEFRQQGLAFDIAGIGTNDTNDRLLSELARHGNGRYYLVGENTGASLAAQLAGAFRPAAENVKVQVKLNPERVGNYKLIGFEKDRLKTEDFHDDSVDAAELAADEAGVAIYQVETLPEGTGEIGEVSVRFRDTASGEMVERVWTIPHDPTTPTFDKADSKTQLATLALLAAQKLQGGPLADAIRFSEHAETIAKLKQTYANDPKAQQMLTLLDALK